MANYPTSLSTNANLYVAVNGVQTTLSASITNSVTTIALTSVSGFPTTGLVTIENNEVVSYTGISGSSLTGCTRGADGTTALAHNAGVTVGLTVVAAHHNLLKDEIIAVETALGTNLSNVQAPGNYITALTSDVSASGPGSASATVNSVGTSSAANIHSAELAANAATDANTPSTIVKRDSSGNFIAGTVTAALTGTASGNLPSSGGTLTGDVTLSDNHSVVLKETTANGTDSITVKAPASVTTSYTIQLPPAVASAGQVLTDAAGTGVLSWATASAGITQLTGDVTAGPGSGSQAATVASVGGQTAAVVAAASQNITNIIINGGMEFWQRNTTFTNPSGGAYTADRWRVATDTTGVTISQETTTKDIGNSSMKMVVTGSPVSHYFVLDQYVENYKDYLGKTITVSARVLSSVASAVRLALNDDTQNVNGAYHSGSGSWETLSVSFTVSNSATNLILRIGSNQAGDLKNGTYYFDSVMMTIGSQAITFVPKNYQDELAQCQRYYEKSYELATAPLTNTAVNIEDNVFAKIGTLDMAGNRIPFKVAKYGQPTVTVMSEGGTTNSWQFFATAGTSTNRTISVFKITTNGFTVRQQVAEDFWGRGHWTAESEI